MKYPEYCVAIRTLGTAGEKYQTLLNSLRDQSLPANKILVYIPYGYHAPKETIGIEQIIHCEKGMVTQRSLPFDEIDTEYVLFCDDDLYLPSDFVEKMFKELILNQGDCISSSVYGLEKKSFFYKLSIFIHSFTSSRKNDGWDVKIKRNAGSSYNREPLKDVLPTESAAFACFLCKMSVHQAIHFEDEKWIELFSFAAGDDTLYYYKMHLMGYKVFCHNKTGIKHLDAQSGIRPNIKKKMFYHKMILFIMWYRIVYSTCHKRFHASSFKFQVERYRCIGAFTWRCIFGVITLPLEVIYYKQPNFFIDYFRGLWAGWKYVHSKDYKAIPKFDAYVV